MKNFYVGPILAIVSTGLPIVEIAAQQPAEWAEARNVITQCPTAAVPKCDCSLGDSTCVREPKHNTKKVYAMTCEGYCLPHSSQIIIFGCKLGCDQESCGLVKARHRLVVKKIPTCDTTQCVLKKKSMRICPERHEALSVSPSIPKP